RQLIDVLSHMSDWSTAPHISAKMPHLGGPDKVQQLLESLTNAGLVQRNGDDQWPWQPWTPEAAFFHFGTRDADYPADKRKHERSLTRKAATNPPPIPYKRYRGE